MRCADRHLDGQLLGSADELQAAGCPGSGGLDGRVQLVDSRSSARRRGQRSDRRGGPRRRPPGCPPGRRGRAVRRDRAGRPRGAARARRAAGRAPRRAAGGSVAWPLARAAIALGHRGVEGDGEDQPGLHADRVEPEQAALEVEQRRARGPARQRRGVLDRPGDPAPARPAQAAPGARDEAVGDPQTATAGVSHARGPPGPGRGAGASGASGIAGASPVVDAEHGKVEVGVEAGDRGRALTRRRRTSTVISSARASGAAAPPAPGAGARARGRRSAPGRARSPPPCRCPSPGPARRCSGRSGRRRLGGSSRYLLSALMVCLPPGRPPLRGRATGWPAPGRAAACGSGRRRAGRRQDVRVGRDVTTHLHVASLSPASRRMCAASAPRRRDAHCSR